METAPPDPFNPPPDYQLEPELQVAAPRPIPGELRRGRYASSQRSQIVGVAVAGVVCLICAWLPFVQTWGLYLLPLAYLHWIGAGLLVFALGAYVVAKVRRGPFRYVVEGTPLVVRVLDLQLRPTAYMNGQPTGIRYFATVGYQDPDTGELKTVETPSNDIGAAFKDGLDCTYRVGDYATAVYLPGDLPRSLRLYGFLDLRPGLGLVKRGRSADKPSSPLATALVVTGVIGFIFVLLWNVYALGRYRPLEWHWSMLYPGIGGGAVLGGLLLFSLWAEQRRTRRKREADNARAVAEGRALEPEPPSVGTGGAVFLGLVGGAGALGLGGLTCVMWAWTLNAWLDTPKSRPRPVVIERMIQTTHGGIFRQYEIEYRLRDEPNPEKREYLSTPAEMAQFWEKKGWADEKPGFFGWPWVERIRPMGGGPLDIQ